MKRLTIIVPDGQSDFGTVSCIIGAYDMFMAANEYRRGSGRKELFTVELTGASKKSKFNNGLLTITPSAYISDIPKTDLIIIPSLVCEYQQASKSNRKLIDWIANQYSEGAEIACMCTGSYWLADIGLIDGKSCSVHWSVSDQFRSLFPEVKLNTGQFITDEDGIYTNGGGYSFLNLIIYLIEKYYDRPTAIYCAKIFQVEIDRQSQSDFIIFTGQKQHDDEVVKKAQTYMEKNIQEKISVEHLSSKFAVGRRTFDRRFIRATGNTPLEYSQRVKIEFAKKSLETSRKNVNEVMYDVGYSDVKAFREIFKKITGISPLEYRNKYNKSRILPPNPNF